MPLYWFDNVNASITLVGCDASGGGTCGIVACGGASRAGLRGRCDGADDGCHGAGATGLRGGGGVCVLKALDSIGLSSCCTIELLNCPIGETAGGAEMPDTVGGCGRSLSRL
jgi:hypothetical protein